MFVNKLLNYLVSRIGSDLLIKIILVTSLLVFEIQQTFEIRCWAGVFGLSNFHLFSNFGLEIKVN